MTVPSVLSFPSHDPWQNLAREETWLDALPAGQSRLVLYVNSPCIVLGKHQNPLREVRLDEADRRGVPLVRRTSGGGTVWHDEGNLNWSWLGPKDGYERAEVSATVASALAPLGLTVDVGDKGDLFLGGKKVSGAAYLFRRDRVLHHGTLLCRARLDDLHGVLGPTGTLVDWVGVASRPQPVTNLNIDVAAAAGALVAGFSASSATVSAGSGDGAFEARVAARAASLGSEGWLWDQTPPFTWKGATRHGELTATVRSGMVEALRDDTNRNLSNMVGKRFFDPEFFDYIRTREVV